MKSCVLLVTLFLCATSNAQESPRAKGVIYGITADNQLMWMRHDGRADGSFRWAPMPNGGKLVGRGWNFKQVFGGGDGIIYGAVQHDFIRAAYPEQFSRAEQEYQRVDAGVERKIRRGA